MTNFAGSNFGNGVPPGYGHGHGYGAGYGAPQQLGHGAPYGYPAPAPAPEPERFSPAAQAVISGLLLVPAILILFLESLLRQASWAKEWSEPLRNVWYLACNSLPWLYLLVVVAFWARRNRRVAGVSLVIAMAILDTALAAAYLWYPSIYEMTGDSPALMWVLDAAPVLIAVGQAAVWGVARRRGRIWPVGLIATVALATVDQVVRQSLIRDAVRDHDSFTGGWWNQWWGMAATSLGIFVLSCLICWAVDAMSSGARRTTTPQFGGR